VNCELPELFSLFLRTNSRLLIVEHTTKPWLFFPALGKIVRTSLKFKKVKWISVSSSEAIWMGPKSPDYIIPNLVKSSGKIFQELQKECRITRLVFIGRFAIEKNPMAVCEVSAKLDMPVLFIGDGILREQILTKCQDFGLDFKIQSFLPNPWSLIEPGDVVIVPSLWEGDGLVVLEALHLGVPILVSDNADMRRLKLPEKNYFNDLVSCEDRIRTNLSCATNLRVPPPRASSILVCRSDQNIYTLWATCLSDL